MTILNESTYRSKVNPMTYYQGFLAIAAILIFFTRVDVYLDTMGFGIPLYWMIGFLAASVPLALSLISEKERLSKPVLVWIAGFIASTFTLIVIQPKLPVMQNFEDQYRTIIFLLLMLVIFAYHPLVIKWTKYTIMAVTLANIVMFVLEFFNPLAFRLEQRAPGRSSGFYDDANTAGIALVLGMILTIDLVKPKYRIFYALLIFLGLAPTFSRGSIAGWVLLVGLMILMKLIPRTQIPLLGGFAVAILITLSSQIDNLAYLKTADGTTLFQEDTLARVEFLIDPFAQSDSSKASRLSHVDDAWEKFANSPFIGNGLGAGQNAATESQVGKAQRSHNTYLDLMVEFGFLGALIYPMMLLASVWKASGTFKQQGVCFVVFMLFQGFFSHTLLNEFCSLICYAMVASLARHSSINLEEKLSISLYQQLEAKQSLEVDLH